MVSPIIVYTLSTFVALSLLINPPIAIRYDVHPIPYSHGESIADKLSPALHMLHQYECPLCHPISTFLISPATNPIFKFHAHTDSSITLSKTFSACNALYIISYMSRIYHPQNRYISLSCCLSFVIR